MLTNYPELIKKIEFFNLKLSDFHWFHRFDYIFSKDTFEHILNLPKMLDAMKECLKPCGQIFVGFAPLYNSYYGDHMLTNSILPWFHLIIPESILSR